MERGKENIRDRTELKKNLMITVITPVVLVICLAIKWVVRKYMMTYAPIFKSGLLSIMYVRHYCDYLEIQNGVIVWGRIFVMISMALTFYLKMFSSKKRDWLVIIFNMTLIISVVVINSAIKPVEMHILCKFIIQIILWTMLYLAAYDTKVLESTVLRVVFAIYLAGNLGNIIEANMIGWVTDYVWLLPTYGKTLVYNLEDFIIIGAYVVTLMIGFKWIAKDLITDVKEKQQSEINKSEKGHIEK